MRIFKFFHNQNGIINQHLFIMNRRTIFLTLLVIILFRFIIQLEQIVHYLLHVLIDEVMLIVVDFYNLSQKYHPVKLDYIIDKITVTDLL
jgi:hypothetical protein